MHKLAQLPQYMILSKVQTAFNIVKSKQFFLLTKRARLVTYIIHKVCLEQTKLYKTILSVPIITFYEQK